MQKSHRTAVAFLRMWWELPEWYTLVILRAIIMNMNESFYVRMEICRL